MNASPEEQGVGMPAAKRDANGNIMRKNGKIVRDYRKEYDSYHGTAEQKKNRSSRNGARYAINRKRKSSGQPKLRTTQEVDHIRPLSKGGSNGSHNTRVVSRTTNRKKSNK